MFDLGEKWIELMVMRRDRFSLKMIWGLMRSDVSCHKKRPRIRNHGGTKGDEVGKDDKFVKKAEIENLMAVGLEEIFSFFGLFGAFATRTLRGDSEARGAL